MAGGKDPVLVIEPVNDPVFEYINGKKVTVCALALSTCGMLNSQLGTCTYTGVTCYQHAKQTLFGN